MADDQEKTKKLSLIELLGIIVFVSIVSYASFVILEDARGKALRASAKEYLLRMGIEAENFFGNNNSYDGFCQSGDLEDWEHEIALDQNIPTSNYGHCLSSKDEWRIIYPLSRAGKFWCADSVGFLGEIEETNIDLGLIRCKNILSESM